MKTKEIAYSADHINTLDDRAHVRRTLGMYVGGGGADGMNQLLWEVVDNCVDEHLAAHNQFVSVTIDADGYATVEDHGRGVPVEAHSVTGIPAVIMAYSHLKTGGKFRIEGKEGAFSAATTGLHGTGVKATNFLSESFSVETRRKNGVYRVEWRADLVTPSNLTGIGKLVKVADKAKTTGTTVRFLPERTIFPQIEWDENRIKTVLRELAFTCPGCLFRLDYRGRVTEYQTEAGLRGRFDEMLAEAKAEPKHDVVTHNVKVNDDLFYEIVFAWTNDVRDERFVSYVNTKPVVEGGTHETGIRRAITNIVSKKKEAKGLELKDFRAGLYAVVHIKMTHPEFKGQTKNRLNNAELDGLMSRSFQPLLVELFAKHPELLDGIIARAAELKKARKSFKELEKTIAAIDSRSKGRVPLPGKLAGAPNCKASEREIFLVEGDSAGGSAKKARDPYCQEVLPLKGKILNVIQASTEAALKNDEVQNIIAALGCGIDQMGVEGEGCKPEKARVARVYLLMDADPDGQHIMTLVLAFFETFMRPMLADGRVFVVDSPLFVGKKAKARVYGYTQEEVQSALPGCQIVRLKGHGEAQPEELQHYAMDTESRKTIKVSPDGGAVLRSLMGKDVAPRRKLLGLEQTTHKTLLGKRVNERRLDAMRKAYNASR